MSIFKKKKQSTQINVCLENREGETKLYTIKIPDGGRYRITYIGNDLDIYDKDDNLVSHYNWQAGFSTHYQFIYTL